MLFFIYLFIYVYVFLFVFFFILSFVWCYFVLVFFSPLSIAITSLGEERELILVLFVRLFDLRLFGLSVSFSSWCLGRVAACDCGTPWTFLPSFPMYLSYILYFT